MRLEGKKPYLEELLRLTERKRELGTLAGEAKNREAFMEVQRAEDQFFQASEEAFGNGLFLPLEYLSGILNISPFERHCILMALGWELGCPSVEDCVRLNGNGELTGLTPKLLAMTWQGEKGPEEICKALGDDSLLMRIFFRNIGASSPFLDRLLCLKPRIRDFLMWQLESSGEASRVIEGCWAEEELPPLEGYQPDLAAVLDEATEVAEVWGQEGSGRRFSVRTACQRLGMRGLPISLKEAAACGWTPEETAEAAALECILYQAAPVLVIPDQWEKEERERWLSPVVRMLRQEFRPVFTVAGRKQEGAVYGRDTLVRSFEVPKMTLKEARDTWRREAEPFSFESDVRPEEMANLFPFTRGQIREALINGAFEAGAAVGQRNSPAKNRDGGKLISRENLQRGCYSLFEKQLVTRAVRIPCTYGWEDLVLPMSQKEKLRAAVGQIRCRHQVYEEWGFQQKMPYGRGVSMIFAGPPGTGKTMAAQVFAGELGLDLYKVELSLVVSKYVGETEKNLDEIFRQAEKSQVVLFFDEADVLFAKRTEVKDANDKYSNMEAAYLLQKMEAYEGVTVLATNLIQNFDEAFKRRMKFIVEFPFPGREERLELWHRAIPASMPMEDLDYEYLASAFELSGSNIRNIVLHGAFLAAEAGKAVGMEELLRAVKNEFSKSGKVLTRDELGEYHILLPEVR